MGRQEPPWQTALYIVASIVFLPVIIIAAPFYLIYRVLKVYYESPYKLAQRTRSQTGKLYDQAISVSASFPDAETFTASVFRELGREIEKYPVPSILIGMGNASEQLYAAEALRAEAIPSPPLLESLEAAQYRDKLISYIDRVNDSEIIDVARGCLVESFKGFISTLPQVALTDDIHAETNTQFSVHFEDVLQHPGRSVEELILPFYAASAFDHSVFNDLREQLDRNVCAVSGLPFTAENRRSSKLVMPSNYSGADVVKRYLQQTPLLGLFDAEVPFDFPPATRFAGTWIVAPPGRGKTNLLHNLIAADLKHHCTIVLMDSKGDLINSYKACDNAIVIAPKTANINPLQLGSSTRSVEFLEYIFSALLDTGMTALQKTLFRSVLTVLIRVPNATLETFRQILTVGWRPLELEPYILQTDPATQDFFLAGKKPEFENSTYGETKQQILWRLRLILSNDYLRAIFTAPTTNVPFSQLLDSGKVIIIDNSKDDLGEDGAEFFGRFFVALVWMAAVSRSRLRPEQKVPVYFYIDECHTVIKRDTKITTILDECRSQKIALILAHQRIAQINPEVIDALNNCAIRLANSDDDAESLGKRFRVEAPALRLPIGRFACFVRDKTQQAVTINVPLFDMSEFPPSPSRPPDEPAPPAPEPPTVRVRPRAVPTDEVEDF